MSVFKRIIASVAAASVAVSSITFAVLAYESDQETGLLAAEDFEEAIEGWSAAPSDSMTIEDDEGNGVCRLSSTTDSTAWLKSSGWTDYTVNARIKPVSGKRYFSAGVAVRVIDQDNYIFIRMSGGEDSITKAELYQWENGNAISLESVDWTFEYGEWYDFEVTAEYNTVTAKINGETVFDSVTIPSKYGSGTAGLKSRYGTAYFDDIRVTETEKDPADTAVYGTDSDEYSESGEWDVSELSDNTGEQTMRISYDKSAAYEYSFYAPNLAAEQEANYMVFAWLPDGIATQSVVTYTIRTLNGTWTKGIKQIDNTGGWYHVATVKATGDTAMSVEMEAEDTAGCIAGPIKVVKTLSEADEPGAISGGIDTQTVSVLVNQIGYDIGGIKRATVTNTEDGTEYFVKRADNDETVYTGEINSGIADFSSFDPDLDTEYYIECSGARSYNFAIEKNLYQQRSVPVALEFMEYSRNDAWLPGKTSIAWRDSHQFSFELPTMVMQYMANPALFENMERDIYKIEETQFEDLRAQNEPDIIWLMKYGMEWYYNDNTVTGHNLHPLIKEQVAYFLYIYPYIKDYVKEEEYIKYRDWLIGIWGNSDSSNSLSYYAVSGEKYNLFEVQTAVGQIKGSFPPGHSIAPNLMMYEVLKRDGISGSEKYFEAAYNNAEYIINNIDITAPEYSKGQRMSEHVLMENLAYFQEMYPDRAPEGLKQAIDGWSDKMTARADNIWDMRMASSVAAGDEKDYWTGAAYAFNEGQATSVMNEPGSEIGFQAAAYAAARVTDNSEKAQRLKEIGDAGRDNMYGRNPHGRMFFYEATDSEKGIEGADLGWFATHESEGNGKLAICPGRIDGSPKEGAYPYSPEADYGYVEGWVAYNSCWNAALAYASAADTEVTVDKNEVSGGETVNISLKAPVNMDPQKKEQAFVYISAEDGAIEKISLTELSDDDYIFSGSYKMPEEAGKYTISYGIGNFAQEKTVVVDGGETDGDEQFKQYRYKIVDLSFDESRDDTWGFTKSGSGFDVCQNNGMLQFKGGNGTSSPGVALFDIPTDSMGNKFTIDFDIYHPLAESGDTFVRFTDDNNKDIFSFYMRESASASNIEGKTMRYGFNTVLGSNSLNNGANGSAKYINTPETGNIGSNGIVYSVHSEMDFETKTQRLIVKNKETGETVLDKESNIKNAQSLSTLKIGFGYASSSYEGVYVDNLVITAEPETDIMIKDFKMNKGNISSEIINLSGKEQNLVLAYAIYNEDGTLSSLDYKNEILGSDQGSNSVEFTGSTEYDPIDLNEVSLYIWESGTMRPMTKTVSVTDSGNEYNIAAMVQPVPKSNQLIDEGYYTWCGSYIKGDDGKYHVFYSRWKLEYGFVPGWVSHSEIAHAVSDNIDGPYVFKDVVLGARDREYWDGTTAHNPYIIEKDGKYYLYYMGTTAPEGTVETPSSYSPQWYEYRNRQQIGVAVSDSLDGPWTRLDEPVFAPDKEPNEDGSTKWDSMLVSNPALTVMPDGRILLIYKGVQDTTGGDTSKKNGVVKIGVAIADDPQGPFVRQEGLIFEGEGTLAAEDPFVWYSERNKKYYAVVRDASASFTGIEGALALFESVDGVSDWQPAKNILVLDNYITWEDGTTNNSRVERPWLMFDDNGEPVMLFGATRINNNESFTTNVFIPLSSE